jgi:hypothetical protein
MPIPFSLSATLNLPGGPALPNDPISATVSQNFDNQTEYRLSLSGSGTKVLDLGSVGAPGAKGLMILVEASSTAAPVEVRLNGSATGGVEVSPGGLMVVGNPSPVSGITAVSLVYTTAVTVRIWLLG